MLPRMVGILSPWRQRAKAVAKAAGVFARSAPRTRGGPERGLGRATAFVAQATDSG